MKLATLTGQVLLGHETLSQVVATGPGALLKELHFACKAKQGCGSRASAHRRPRLSSFCTAPSSTRQAPPQSRAEQALEAEGLSTLALNSDWAGDSLKGHGSSWAPPPRRRTRGTPAWLPGSHQEWVSHRAD